MESCSLAVKWHDAIKCSVCIFMQLNITIRWVGRARKRESVKHFFRQRKWKLVSRLCNTGQRRTLGMLTHKEEEEERILVIFSIIISQRISFCLDSFNEKISIFVLNLSDSRKKNVYSCEEQRKKNRLSCIVLYTKLWNFRQHHRCTSFVIII